MHSWFKFFLILVLVTGAPSSYAQMDPGCRDQYFSFFNCTSAGILYGGGCPQIIADFNRSSCKQNVCKYYFELQEQAPDSLLICKPILNESLYNSCIQDMVKVEKQTNLSLDSIEWTCKWKATYYV